MLADLDGDGSDEIVIADAWTGWAFQRDAAGKWHPAARLTSDNLSCADALQALRAGTFTVGLATTAEMARDRIKGQRVHVTESRRLGGGAYFVYQLGSQPAIRCW